MKKLYTILALSASLFAGNKAMAQCGLSLSTTARTVCAGDSVTITATATPPSTSVSLATTLAAGNNHRGNMFDIYATNTVTIDSFDAHPAGNTTIEIYYKTGTYVGSESNSAAWTLIGSAAVTANPTGTPTPVPVTVNVTIPAGQVYAFYVTSTNTAVSLNYTNGTAVGNTFVSDANINFLEGAGLEYPFTNGSGSYFTPRVWNGVIHYSVPSAATYTYLWNTTATTPDIHPTLNATTQYNVQVDVTGCPTMYDTITVTVSTPPVNAGQDVAVCTGSPVTLSGSGAASYSWDNSVTDNTPFTPAATMSYVVTGTDSIGCTAVDTVTVTVNPLPAVSAGNDTMVCAGTSATLAGSGAVFYSWDNNVTDGIAFVPASSGSYIVTGTDANGCSDMDTVNVTVNTVNVSTSFLNETITAAAGGATYQWADCNGYVLISGASAQSYTATVNGSYAVIVTENGCTDTSSCTTISSVGIGNIVRNGGLSLYPNPANAQVVVNTGDVVATEIAVVDLTGKTIFRTKPSSAQVTIDLGAYADGVYFVRIATAEGVRTEKLVKQ